MCNHGISTWCSWCVRGCVHMSAYHGMIVGTGIFTGIVWVQLLALHGTGFGEEFVTVSAVHQNSWCVIPVLLRPDLTGIYLDVFISSQSCSFMSSSTLHVLQKQKKKEKMTMIELNPGSSCRFTTEQRSRRPKVGNKCQTCAVTFWFYTGSTDRYLGLHPALCLSLSRWFPWDF